MTSANSWPPICAPKGGGAAYIAELEKRISVALGRNAKIRHGDGRGKVELEYTSDADFECLLSQLGVELQ